MSNAEGTGASQLVPSEVTVGPQSFGFTEVSHRAYSGGGTLFSKLANVGMPRIPPAVLSNACYLYSNESDARIGANFGGTAFLVGVDSEVEGQTFVYAVTNWHVAVRDGFSVLRVNRKDVAEADIFELGPEDWQFLPQYDIAVAPIALDSRKHDALLLVGNFLISREQVEKADLTPGENVFMVGRFVDHDGGPVNRPAVRFGNISVMPWPMMQANGVKAEAFCLDLHSRSGYSGSPVFVYRTPGFDLEANLHRDQERTVLLSGVNLLRLLGIHFGQFAEDYRIVPGQAATQGEASIPLLDGGASVRGLSGMTCVLPAWNIKEVLDMPKLKAQRAAHDARTIASQAAQGQSAPMGESTGTDSR